MKPITARQLIARLNELLEEYDVEDLPIVYAQDDEGNYIDFVRFEPLACDFHDRETVVFHDFTSKEKFIPNAICIN